jgi:hypothetical protein
MQSNNLDITIMLRQRNDPGVLGCPCDQFFLLILDLCNNTLSITSPVQLEQNFRIIYFLLMNYVSGCPTSHGSLSSYCLGNIRGS